MAPSLKATPEGLKLVDLARKKKGWTKTAQLWCDAAQVGQSTLRRFWRRNPINQENFVEICKAVGIDWEEIIDEGQTVSPTNDRTAESRWKVELTAIVQESEKQLMDELLALVQKLSGTASFKVEVGFDEGWQSPDSLLPPNKRGFRSKGGPKPPGTEEFAKEIDFGLGQKAILVVQRTPESDREISVVLDVYPAADAACLPPNLEVMVIDESEEIVPDLHQKTDSDSSLVKLEFTMEEDELVAVRFKLGNVSITENL